MINGWMEPLLAGIQALNQILTAGIAITAFSLFLYALSFNLRDRVARSFAIILLCVVIVFTAEALQDESMTAEMIQLLLRLQWFGIVFLPAAYLHLSDALLVTAGRPSRGRRRLAVRGIYVVSAFFLVLLAFGYLLGPVVMNGKPAPHLERTVWTEVFTLFYVTAMVWAGVNFARAYMLMLSSSGRRRMLYLMAGATAPALGSYPYLLFGYGLAARHTLFILERGDGYQRAGWRAGDHDGVRRCLLWRFMARPCDQKPSVQVDHARTRDRLHRPGIDDHCPPRRGIAWFAL